MGTTVFASILRLAGPMTFAAFTLFCLFSAGTAEGEVFEQLPVLAQSQVRGETATESPAAPEDAAIFQKGPTPQWIWAAGQPARCVLAYTFETSAKTSWLRASCDNRLNVFLNGKPVAASDNWQQPVTRDVSAALVEGENQLLIECENEGGPAACVLKLALWGESNEVEYVVTGEAWQAADSRTATAWSPVDAVADLGAAPWGDIFSAAAIASAPVLHNIFETLPGYQVELLYTVPKEQQGSWVCLATDDRGRLLASDQDGAGLYRITPAPLGSAEPTRVEKLSVPITAAQGMLYAFGNLYLSVNGGPGSGFYRARDTDGDDQFDEVKLLAPFRGGGEHGPHTLRLSPDGQSIYVICGNHTDPPEKIDASRLPTNWGEDHLLPRQWDANGHAVGRLAPGGWIAKTDPEGQTWEIISIGYRNPYDMDFNADGELFAYDADMEWDLGTPWYRPTRVVHVTSGSEFGWRSGTGKWPAWYVDSLPPAVEIGPGSPVGATFGYGLRFPAKYQRALYICDWTFGTMYAIHFTPSGATYAAEKEEFLSRSPLPLTDVVVGADGALYFTVGGRGAQSELYRATYVGDESVAPAELRDAAGAGERELRRQLEALHRAPQDAQGDNAQTLDFIYSNLGHADRWVRYAARVALERQPVERWLARLLAEREPETLITGSVALARQGRPSMQSELLKALSGLDLATLTEEQLLELMRVYELAFIRLGPPNETEGAEVLARLDPLFPAPSDPVNRELSNVLVYLQSPTLAAKMMPLLEHPAEQQPEDIAALLARNAGYGGTVAAVLANLPELQNLHYVFALRNLRAGWTLEERIAYFQWIARGRTRSGGASYQGFLTNIATDAFANMTDAERLAIEALNLRQPYQITELPKPEGPGQTWDLDGLLAIQGELRGRNFERGQRMFAAARCVVCHRFNGDGGATGPDLTQLASRFTFKDLCENIVLPSKVVSDQYRATTIVTDEGQQYTGRLIRETAESLLLLTDPENPTKSVEIPLARIEQRETAPLSLMPADLLKQLNQDEVLDLLAYLLSRGNPQDSVFSP